MTLLGAGSSMPWVSQVECALLVPVHAADQANGEPGSEGEAAADGVKPKSEEEEGEEEAEPIDEAAQEQATDDLALTIIMGIVSNRAPPPGPPPESPGDKREERRSGRGEFWSLFAEAAACC